jgi:hypothetical protein
VAGKEVTKILSAVTKPWPEPFARRHEPPEADYTTYRPCLRWEFGFTCPFCLVHESDIAACGASGWRVMSIEHLIAQSRDEDMVNYYPNCFLACALCNSSRRNLEHALPGGPRLLNPCEDTWAEHFETADDEIYPLADGDENAHYTSETYDFNDPRKTKCRELRRLVVNQCNGFLERSDRLHEQLLDRAEQDGDPSLVDLAEEIGGFRRLPLLDLLKHRAIPLDHDPSCRCGEKVERCLPKVVEDQTFPWPG